MSEDVRPPEERALEVLLGFDGWPLAACFPAETMPLGLVSELIQKIADLKQAREGACTGWLSQTGPILSLETRGPTEDARRRREAEDQFRGARRDFNRMRDDGSLPKEPV